MLRVLEGMLVRLFQAFCSDHQIWQQAAGPKGFIHLALVSCYLRSILLKMLLRGSSTPDFRDPPSRNVNRRLFRSEPTCGGRVAKTVLASLKAADAFRVSFSMS